MLRQVGCLLFVVLASCSSDERDAAIRCATHDECQATGEAFPERCAPRDWYCREGTCVSQCAESCQVAADDVNPCTDEKLICNAPRETPIELPHCTGRPIECSSTADCPRFSPSGEGSWTCDGGICRFPGFQYAAER